MINTCGYCLVPGGENTLHSCRHTWGEGVDFFPLRKLLVWIHKRLDLLPWTARLKLSMTLSIHLGENIKKLDSILSRDLLHRIYIFGIKQLVFKTFWDIFVFLVFEVGFTGLLRLTLNS